MRCCCRSSRNTHIERSHRSRIGEAVSYTKYRKPVSTIHEVRITRTLTCATFLHFSIACDIKVDFPAPDFPTRTITCSSGPESMSQFEMTSPMNQGEGPECCHDWQVWRCILSGDTGASRFRRFWFSLSSWRALLSRTSSWTREVRTLRSACRDLMVVCSSLINASRHQVLILSICDSVSFKESSWNGNFRDWMCRRKPSAYNNPSVSKVDNPSKY